MSNKKTDRTNGKRGLSPASQFYLKWLSQFPPEEQARLQAEHEQGYEALSAVLLAARFLDNAIHQVEASKLPDKPYVLTRLQIAMSSLLDGVDSDPNLARLSVLKMAAQMRRNEELDKVTTEAEEALAKLS